MGSCWPPNTDEYLTCADGFRCQPSSHGWGCCVTHGGRTRCPASQPVMCNTPSKCGGGQDYCCSQTQETCQNKNGGGKRPCASQASCWPPNTDEYLTCAYGFRCQPSSHGWGCCVT